MQQWEYCAIHGMQVPVTGGAGPVVRNGSVWKFSVHGVDVRKINGDQSTETAKLIASLGHDGWEMVGCGSLAAGSVIYFKRPKQEASAEIDQEVMQLRARRKAGGE